MHKIGMRIIVIGVISKFEQDIQQSLQDLVKRTDNNTKITVVFALNYGGRDEIIRAMNQAISYQLLAIRQKKDQGNNNVAEGWKLKAESYVRFLDTAGIPDPELIVRTGGEKRLSGFLLWQSEYSELYFVDWYMPEFTPERLDKALEEYAHRKRRFGK